MDIKGTAVISVRNYVQKKHPDSYNTWLNALPQKSRQIFTRGIYATEWYPIHDAVIVPTGKAGDVFFNGQHEKAAWENGRFSANEALKGLYWFYVKVGSPTHLIRRSSRIFSAYYKNVEVSAENISKNSAELVIRKFETPSAIMEARISGWVERALEISGCSDIHVDVPQSLVRGDEATRLTFSWAM